MEKAFWLGLWLGLGLWRIQGIRTMMYIEILHTDLTHIYPAFSGCPNKCTLHAIDTITLS